MAERPRVTIADVARAAHVSRATVSKSINGRPDVSEQTRRHVLELASSMGYSPAPPTGAERVITILFDTVDTYYTNRVLDGAIAAAQEQAVILDVRASQHLPGDDSGDWLRSVAAAGHLAVIVVTTRLTSTLLEAARETSLPIISIDPVQAVPSDVLSISSTNWNGGMLATQHLLALGHRRIGFIAGPDGSLPARERLMGFRSALLDATLDVNEELVQQGGFTYQGGLDAASRMLAMPAPERPTAVIAVSDPVAIGVYEAARRAGVSVPGDLSVVGFDDTFLAQCAAPPLTTVHQALEAMGARAVQAAIEMSEQKGRGPLLGPGSVQIPVRLVTRSSTTRPAMP